MKETNRSADNRILIVISVFVLLALSLTVTTYYGNKTVTAVRAYVTGQGHWSKAQKDASLYLIRYVTEPDSSYYNLFDRALQVNRGDRAARITLSSDSPDYELAKRGFLQGDNQPEDIDYMIWMFDNFQDMPHMREAISIWETADEKIEILDRLGQEIRVRVEAGELTDSLQAAYLDRIYELDGLLTQYGKDFTMAMNRAAHWTNNMVYWLTIILGFVMITTGAVITTGHLRSVRSWNRKLQQSEEQLRNVLKHSRDVVYKFDLTSGRYEYMSNSVEDMLGYRVDEVLEGGIDFIIDRIHPEDAKKMAEIRDDLMAKDVEKYYNTNSEFRIKNRNGEYIWVSNLRSFIFDEEGNPKAIVGNVRDISELKKNERRLDQSLKEKNVLLAEIHHRVKNNLAVISGLLVLQAERSPTDEISRALRDSQNRIISIAEVHELLYRNNNFSEIDIKKYLDMLISRITSSQSLDTDIRYQLEVEGVGLNIVKAIPFGLLTNELVTNSIKHAFNGRERGTIKLSIYEESETTKVVYEDDGVGFDPELFTSAEYNTLGMQLIKTLLQQLQAEYTIHETDRGFKLSLQFQNSSAGDSILTR